MFVKHPGRYSRWILEVELLQCCKNALFIVKYCMLLYPPHGTGSSLVFYLKKIQIQKT